MAAIRLLRHRAAGIAAKAAPTATMPLCHHP